MVAVMATGCGPTVVDTTPGRSRGVSINGTGAFAELLRQRGFEVRVARRATDTLADWADVVVRFSLRPGLPGREEGRWLEDWLRAEPNRKLVYVAHDFDAESEFWDAMLAAEPKDASPDHLEQVKRKRDQSKLWTLKLPPKAKETAGEEAWFSLEPKPMPPSPCKALEGPWAVGVDAEAAAIPRHETFRRDGDEPVLLSGDGAPLAIAWSFDNGSQVLALANASFLLNAPLLNRARRPLAARVADWIGNPPSRVAFVEGISPMDDEEDGSSSPFRLLAVPPFGWISAQVLGFLLLLALSQAVRLGRPSPEEPTGVERPSAHPEALGALLAKTKRAEAARSLLEAYRRWRHPSLAAGRKAAVPPPPRRVSRP